MAKDEVTYIWRAELIADEDTADNDAGDVIGEMDGDTLPNLLQRLDAATPDEWESYRVCLVRVGYRGSLAYAYVRDGGRIDHEFRDVQGVPVAGVPNWLIVTANEFCDELWQYSLCETADEV